MSKLTKEQWDEVLKEISDGSPVIEVAEKYGVHRGSIYAKLNEQATPKQSTLEMSKLKKENRELKEIIGYLTHELSREKKLLQ